MASRNRRNRRNRTQNNNQGLPENSSALNTNEANPVPQENLGEDSVSILQDIRESLVNISRNSSVVPGTPSPVPGDSSGDVRQSFADRFVNRMKSIYGNVTGHPIESQRESDLQTRDIQSTLKKIEKQAEEVVKHLKKISEKENSNRGGFGESSSSLLGGILKTLGMVGLGAAIVGLIGDFFKNNKESIISSFFSGLGTWFDDTNKSQSLPNSTESAVTSGSSQNSQESSSVLGSIGNMASENPGVSSAAATGAATGAVLAGKGIQKSVITPQAARAATAQVTAAHTATVSEATRKAAEAQARLTAAQQTARSMLAPPPAVADEIKNARISLRAANAEVTRLASNAPPVVNPTSAPMANVKTYGGGALKLVGRVARPVGAVLYGKQTYDQEMEAPTEKTVPSFLNSGMGFVKRGIGAIDASLGTGLAEYVPDDLNETVKKSKASLIAGAGTLGSLVGMTVGGVAGGAAGALGANPVTIGALGVGGAIAGSSAGGSLISGLMRAAITDSTVGEELSEVLPQVKKDFVDMGNEISSIASSLYSKVTGFFDDEEENAEEESAKRERINEQTQEIPNTSTVTQVKQENPQTNTTITPNTPTITPSRTLDPESKNSIPDPLETTLSPTDTILNKIKDGIETLVKILTGTIDSILPSETSSQDTSFGGTLSGIVNTLISSIASVSKGVASGVASGVGATATPQLAGAIGTAKPGGRIESALAVGGAGSTDNAQTAMEFFIKKGWSEEQAAGIVGNLQQESGKNLNIRSFNRKENAHGIAQWRDGRLGNFERVTGIPIQQSTLEQQLEFIDWELRNSENKAGEKLRGATTAEESAIAIDRFYERSSGEHRTQRAKNANSLLYARQQAAAKANSESPSVNPVPENPKVDPKVDPKQPTVEPTKTEPSLVPNPNLTDDKRQELETKKRQLSQFIEAQERTIKQLSGGAVNTSEYEEQLETYKKQLAEVDSQLTIPKPTVEPVKAEATKPIHPDKRQELETKKRQLAEIIANQERTIKQLSGSGVDLSKYNETLEADKKEMAALDEELGIAAKKPEPTVEAKKQEEYSIEQYQRELGATRISSEFGPRSSPTAGASTNHKGIDFAAKKGTPVSIPSAMKEGTVTFAGTSRGYGNMVEVQHSDGTKTRYAHLDSIDVKKGDTVTSSKPVGAVGSTGVSSGNHLHFEMINAKGEKVNPRTHLANYKAEESPNKETPQTAEAKPSDPPRTFLGSETLGNFQQGLSNLVQGRKRPLIGLELGMSSNWRNKNDGGIYTASPFGNPLRRNAPTSIPVQANPNLNSNVVSQNINQVREIDQQAQRTPIMINNQSPTQPQTIPNQNGGPTMFPVRNEDPSFMKYLMSLIGQ